jgi:hypothetical protein
MSIFFAGNQISQRHGLFNPPVASGPIISYLVVGGGGGGGSNGINDFSSGGGAGGFLTGSLTWVSGITFVATRGVYGLAGGNDGNLDYAGSNGGNSSLVYSGNTILSYGGGGGGTNDFNGGNGGSGGGNGSSGLAPTGVAGQGNNGGIGAGANGGGGGGAGGVGGDAYDDDFGNHYTGSGGYGLVSSITGTSVIYSVGASGSGADNFSPNPTGWGNKGSGGTQGNLGQDGGYGSGWNGVVILSVPTSKYTGTITGSPSVTTDGSGNTIIIWEGLSGTYIS